MQVTVACHNCLQHGEEAGEKGKMVRKRKSEDVVHKLLVSLEKLYNGTIKCAGGQGQPCCLPGSLPAAAMHAAMQEVVPISQPALRHVQGQRHRGEG
jgi:hypothetical protein